ncbi:MAG: GNAT family protein [Planctomycetota bacterium]
MSGVGFANLELRDGQVRLSPTGAGDVDSLWQASLGADPWRYAPVQPRSRDQLAAVIARMEDQRRAGLACAFTIRIPDGTVVGSTAYLARDAVHRRVEIGATWLALPFRRSAVNTSCKLLLLDHAFGPMDCVRVEFKTDARNQLSRAALARLGAREEGTLRAHMVMPDGVLRDSVYFSILASEWPDLRASLAARRSRH